MAILYLLIQNKNRGALRFARYYRNYEKHQQRFIEETIYMKCSNKDENQTSFIDIHERSEIHRAAFRRYANLFVTIGFVNENPFSVLEFIQYFIEILSILSDNNLTEMDILLEPDRIYILLDQLLLKNEENGADIITSGNDQYMIVKMMTQWEDKRKSKGFLFG